MKFIFWLAAMGALGYLFFTVPLGGKTGAQHAAELIRWDVAREKAAVAVAAAGERVKPPAARVSAPAAAAGAPVGKGDHPPAHKVNESERRDLERLVVERTHSN
jgi:hypothetical protein